MSSAINLAAKVIKFEEGIRLTPYYDSLGFPTIGYGELLGKKNTPLPNIVWTEEEAVTALNKHLTSAIKELSSNKTTAQAYSSLVGDDDRMAVLLSLWYQLGINTLSDFKGALTAIANKNYDIASKEMLDSTAARQTPKRWLRQSKAMLSGNIKATYNLQ